MKLFHNIIVSVFIKPEENFDAIKKNFLGLFAFDLEKSKICVEEKNASTFRDRTIKIFEVKITKNRLINDLIDFIKSKLSSEDKEMMIRQLDSRIDDGLNFFFRLSKKQLEEGKFTVVDHGHCYHFKCHVVTYPKSRDAAIKLLIELLSQ